MLIKVLGAGAGGGFPQWNCAAPTSVRAWNGDPAATPRTQASLAVSADGERWVLLNASPDLRQQILATPALHPRAAEGKRNSPIRAVVLTNGDVDAVTGLLTLRERQPFSVFASQRILDVLAANSIFNVLDPSVVDRRALAFDMPMPLINHGDALALTVEAFAVRGKVALYLEEKSQGAGLGTRPGDTIGLRVTETSTGAAFFYIPSCATVDGPLARRLTGVAVVFFDGTLFTDDELVSQGLSDKTGQRMGHISMSGPAGSLAAFSGLDVARKVYIHMNTSNPALIAGSPERQTIATAGWEVAFDGMEIRL